MLIRLVLFLKKVLKRFSRKFFQIYHYLKQQYELPKNSFTIEGKPHNVPCIFQIWELRDEPRPFIVNPEPLFFKFVKKTDSDVYFSIRRVGGTAGKIDTNYQEKSTSSHYFIKLNSLINCDDFLEKYKTLIFDVENTVGPKSISKQEFIEKINSLL